MRTVRGAAVAAALALGLSTWPPYGAATAVAAEPVDLGGQPVDGSTNPAEPTRVEAGLWTSALGPSSQPQYFSYERQVEDSSVHVGVVGTPRTADYDGFTIAATAPTPEDPAGADCGSGDASSDTSYFDAPIGDEVVIGDEDSADDPCRSAATITVTIERYSTSSTEPLPIALKIVEEAPVTDPGEPVAEDAELAYDLPEPVDPVDRPQGAGSFDDAPTIDAHDGPVTVAVEVTEGTTLLWRVPLAWGDQVVARADLPPVDDEDPVLGVGVQVRIVQPSRDTFALTTSEDYYYGDYGEEPAVLVAASHPLRYDNRYRDVEPSLPGDHWVAVSVESAPEDREATEVAVDLTIDVPHVDGYEPTYKAAVLAQGGGAGPDGYTPEKPYLVGDGEFAAVASGNPFTSTGDDEGWWGPRRAVGIGVGVLSLACCAVGAAWLSRRRAASRAAATR